jgi:hypothetical protein
LRSEKTIRARWKDGSWELDTLEGFFRVDSALINVSAEGRGFVDGVLVAVHGLPQSATERMNRDTLRLLGVGGHLGNIHAQRAGRLYRGRAQLTAQGAVEYER